MTDNCMNFRLKQTSEGLIGAEVVGPMIIFGIGVQAQVRLTVTVSVLISVTVSVTHLPQVKT